LTPISLHRNRIDAKQAKQEDCTDKLEDFEKLSAELKPDMDLIARAGEMLKKCGSLHRIRDVKVEFAPNRVRSQEPRTQ
jgi:hypothetical protein